MLSPTFHVGGEGAFFDLAAATYHAAPGISNSMLKHLALDGAEPGSPAHFQEYLKSPPDPTDAMVLGTLAHARILEPEAPLPGLAVEPATYPAQPDSSAVKQGKAKVGDPLPWHNGARLCKEWTAKQKAAGLTIVDAKDIEKLNGVVNAIAAHPTASAALREGASEISLFKNITIGNQTILRKARLDRVTHGNAILDVKTCLDARRGPFGRALHEKRYYVQAAYYLDLWNDLHPDHRKDCFVFIAAEKTAPYAVAVYDLDAKAIEAGRQEYMRNLHLLAACIETGEWPAYDPAVQAIDLPQWAYKRGDATWLL